MDLTASVTRWRRWLDFLLSTFYRGNYRKVEPPLKQILRIAAFECFVAHRPPHAAVSRAVTLASTMVRPGAGRLVNGVLRTMLRSTLPEPSSGDTTDDLATRHSHPTWMVRRWQERLGLPRTLELLKHNNQRPWFGVRCTPQMPSVTQLKAQLTQLGVAWQEPAWLHDFVRVSKVGPLLRAGLMEQGRCAVQDEGAGLVVRLLDPQPDERIIDLCAAPGGKTLYAAERMCNRGAIITNDMHEGRLQPLEVAANAHGISIIEASHADARRLDIPPAVRVLLDVPCTGTGVLAKRADLRWRRSPEDLDRIALVQQELLDAAARLVRRGGILVYSTCSIEAEENEAQVAAFLARHLDFVVETAADLVPSDVVSREGFLRTLPPDHPADGTFAARMRRT